MMNITLTNFTDVQTCQSNFTSITQSLMTCNADILSFQQNQSQIVQQINNCTTSLAAFSAASSSTDDGSTGSTTDPYNKGLHIAAIFIILAASTTGTMLPLLSRYHPKLSIDPYYIILGKCAGIGIILACSLIHMIQPASQSLTDPSLSSEFTTVYPAYAFLYALIGAMAMHFLDFVLEFFITKHLMEHNATQYHLEDPTTQSGNRANSVELTSPKDDKQQEEMKKEQDVEPAPRIIFHRTSQHIVVVTDDAPVPVIQTTPEKEKLPEPIIPAVTIPEIVKPIYFENQIYHHSHGGHSHGALLLSSQRTLSAYLLEFGVTVHSVFIGLENGVVPQSQLKKLLVALCFHQFFEGVALGARIFDAHLTSVWHEIWMTMVFAISAPLGIAIGIGVVDSLDPEGTTYLLTQGTLDGLCGGILLYIGFNLLLRDFQEDMKRFVVGHKYSHYRRMGMFAAMWIGGGLMAFIGKYL